MSHPSSRYEALTIEQWKEAREVAKQKSFLTRASTDVTPFTGLTRNELAHLRKDWISWRENHIEIDIPPTDRCNNWKSSPGPEYFDTPPRLIPRNSPCNTCSKNGNTDGFETHWFEELDRISRGRGIVLHREIAKPAVEWLERVFKVHGRPELGMTASGIDKHPGKLSKELDFDFCYRDLMRTGIVIYAEYEVEIDVIKELTPFAERTIRSVITKTPKLTHPEINKKCTYTELLQVCEEVGQFTASEVAELLPITPSAVDYRINKLIERNKAEKIGETETEKGRQATKIYQLTEPASVGFECMYEGCSFTSDSVKGIDVHERRSH